MHGAGQGGTRGGNFFAARAQEKRGKRKESPPTEQANTLLSHPRLVHCDRSPTSFRSLAPSPARRSKAPAAMDDDDPVIAEYDVFITPEMEQQLYVLQYLNRRPNQHFVKSEGAVPSEVRLKEQSGFIEVDVQLPMQSNYNRQQGVRWGEAMRKTKQLGQKAFGIASGFERVMPRQSRPGAPQDAQQQPALDDDSNFDEYVANFEDANEKGHVLNTQTYGGQIVNEDGKGPTYMVGTFKKSMPLAVRLSSHPLTRARPAVPDPPQRPRAAANPVPPPRRREPARSRPA